VRNLIDIISGKPLFEAEEGERKKKPVKTQDGEKFDFLNSLPTVGGKEVAKAGKKKTTALAGKSAAKTPALKAAGGDNTRRKASGARMNHAGVGAAMDNMMANGGVDSISDEEAFQNANRDTPRRLGGAPLGLGFDNHENLPSIAGDETVTNDNLPAIVNRDLEESGYDVQPEWHQVKHLPAYMLNAIRAGARKVFAEFTDTPIEEIQMICTFMNPESDVRTVMSWVKVNGELADSATMTFGGGIESEVHKYVTPGMTFLLTSDFMGKYVYAWASADDRIGGPEPLKLAAPTR
jgi:hypothetical protein